jgi:hypothetical protein
VSNMANDDHAAWSELAAGYAMSSLDAADEATYLQHAASCTTCRELEHDLSEVLADLAHATPAVAPPAALKATIMRAIHDDDSHQRSTVPIDSRRHVIDLTGAGTSGNSALSATTSATTPAAAVESLARRVRKVPPSWWARVAAGIVVVALVAVWVTPRHKQASVAARCAAVSCPVITLTGGGRTVGAVMVLNDTVYVDAHGLPVTPAGYVYVLWSLSTGKAPVGLAAFRSTHTVSPVRAGSLPVAIGSVSGFAVSQEHGDSVPAAPSARILASGSRA